MFFFDLKRSIINNYPNTFPQARNTNDEEEYHEQERKNLSITEEFYDIWYWYEVLRELACGDITKMDEIAGLNLYTILNDLEYKTHKSKLTNYLNRNGR